MSPLSGAASRQARLDELRARLASPEPTVSFEFHPPRDEAGADLLEQTITALAELRPDFVSVTCGAGGTGHEGTRDLVVEWTRRFDFPVVAHLTCVGFGRDEVARLLDDYAAHGVIAVLALAGDPPADGSPPRGDYRHAIDLVHDIRRHEADFVVGVAAHPEGHPRSPDLASDRRHLAAKLALADFALTQFFFDVDVYTEMVADLDRAGVDRPVIPGVFPVTAPATVRRFAALNATRVPEALFAELEAVTGEERRRLATAHAAALAGALLERGAPGLHLYTMNRAPVAAEVVRRLGLRPGPAG